MSNLGRPPASAHSSAESLETNELNGCSVPDRRFLLRIPKADLHTHLDGSIRISTLIDLAEQQKVDLPSYDETELKQEVFPETYSSLEEYLRGFGYITSVLRTSEALERVAYEVAFDAYDVGVRYIELRFAPQLHAIPGKFSIEEVICSVNRGMERATREADELDWLSGEIDKDTTSDHDTDTLRKLEKLRKEFHPYDDDAPNHHYGIICCAMRFFLPEFSPYYESFWEVHKGEDPHRVFGLASVALVTAVNSANSTRVQRDHDYILPIVAIDVAGAESGYPASDHKEAFDLAHQAFLNKTVHAGEAYGPESIFEAITDLHAERIGHGCNLFKWDIIGEGEGRGGRSKSSREKEEMSDDQKRAYVEGLARYLGTMRTCIEVCLSSNLQTMPELKGDLRNHPAGKMICEGLAVTFCTDNTLVSHTDILHCNVKNTFHFCSHSNAIISSVVQELTKAVEAFDLRPGQLRNIVFNGFKRSFMAKRYRAKREYNRKVISYYKKVEREFGIIGFGSDHEGTNHIN
ncbi:LOW QUALITY PROTEIN: hypothetical protein ACHAWF_007865 [Thalassiosira exigua]